VTSARDLLLSGVSEAELTNHVKSLARRGGWCGYHVRYSEAVVEGVHTMRLNGHSDAHGMPDWVFVNEQPGLPLLLIELKSEKGRVSADQGRWADLLDRTNGVLSAIWRPSDESEIRSTMLGPGH
jgi:hypothetical protein